MKKLPTTPSGGAQAPSAPVIASQKPPPKSKADARGAKPKKQDHNFTQSRDIREDRGTRQIKNTIRAQSAPRGR